MSCYERDRQDAIYAAEHASVDRLTASLATKKDAEEFAIDVCIRHNLAVPDIYWRRSDARQSFAVPAKGEMHLADLKVCTILHEIAHVAVGHSHGHDGVWLSRYQELIRHEMGINAWAEFKAELIERGVAA